MIIYLLSCLKFTFCLAGESLLNGLLLLVFNVRESELLRDSDFRQDLSGVLSFGFGPVVFWPWIFWKLL